MNKLVYFFIYGSLSLAMQVSVYAQTPEELGQLAYKYFKEGYQEEAILYGIDALTQSEKQYGKNDIRYVGAMINLANLYRDSHKSQENENKAKQYYKRIFDFFNENKNHKDTTIEGTFFFSYGIFQENLKSLQLAKEYYQKAYFIYKRNLGETHGLTVKIYQKINSF